MEQELKFSAREIIEKLARIQSDVAYIKQHIKLEENKELKTEMKTWEEASEEDVLNWEKENL